MKKIFRISYYAVLAIFIIAFYVYYYLRVLIKTIIWLAVNPTEFYEEIIFSNDCTVYLLNKIYDK